MTGLETINIELTSRCNKNCWICGRRQRDKEISHKKMYGDMDFEVVKKIAKQIPSGVTVQLHNNGEPTLYPRLGDAIKLFKEKNITNFVTNGKLLLKKFDEIVDNLNTMAISIFENDPEQKIQMDILDEFLQKKGIRNPLVILRLIGNVPEKVYSKFNLPIACRYLHRPEGSFQYSYDKEKVNPTVPEIGICLDLLHHLAIDRFGNVSICVRFDPHKKLVLGNANIISLKEIWNSDKRLKLIEEHKIGRRKYTVCSDCEFYGVPAGIN